MAEKIQSIYNNVFGLWEALTLVVKGGGSWSPPHQFLASPEKKLIEKFRFFFGLLLVYHSPLASQKVWWSFDQNCRIYSHFLGKNAHFLLLGSCQSGKLVA